jgi:hypothetical protein
MQPICIVASCAPRSRINNALAPVLVGSSHLGRLVTESLAVPDRSVM